MYVYVYIYIYKYIYIYIYIYIYTYNVYTHTHIHILILGTVRRTLSNVTAQVRPQHVFYQLFIGVIISTGEWLDL